jgi:hypothetical protein
MSENDERPITEQLMEARDKIRRELELLIAPSSIGVGADGRSAIAALEAELAQIEGELAKSP